MAEAGKERSLNLKLNRRLLLEPPRFSAGTVTLTGQDGFGNDDARTFTATPGAYTFGVCSAAVAAEPSPPAICSVSPASNVPPVTQPAQMSTGNGLGWAIRSPKPAARRTLALSINAIGRSSSS